MASHRLWSAMGAVAVVITSIPAANAQSLTRNPATGNYLLTYTDLDGNAHTVLVEPRDKVLPDLVTVVTDQAGQIVYRYSLTNRIDAPQPIMSLSVPCPGSDAALTVAAPSTWNAEVVSHSDPPVARTWCEFLFRVTLLGPGQTISDLLIQSGFYPAIAEAQVYGSVQTIGLPTAVEETPDTVYRLLDQVQGFAAFGGGGFAVSTVLPARTPAMLADPGQGLDSVASDRSQSCTLGWIADQGVCTTLGGRLDQARQALSQSDTPGARAQLESFLVDLGAQHGPGLPVNENAYWLLKVNAEFVLSRLPAPTGTVVTLFLHGSGGTANPPTLSLSTVAPTVTTAKYKDSPAIKFSGGNAWFEVGTWTAAPGLSSGTLTALGDVDVWIGLKNSDDIGTNFDLRVAAYKNTVLLAAGETFCIQGVTRNAANAKEVTVSFATLSSAPFNGTTDVLSLKVLTRIGTNGAGVFCGGHSNAVGVRLYFDAASRAAQFSGTF